VLITKICIGVESISKTQLTLGNQEEPNSLFSTDLTAMELMIQTSKEGVQDVQEPKILNARSA